MAGAGQFVQHPVSIQKLPCPTDTGVLLSVQSGFRLFLQLAAQGDEDAAHGIAHAHHQQVQHRLGAPHIGHGEIEHIGHTVLKAAEDEHRHAQKDAQILANLMGVVFKAVHRDEHQNVAQDGEDENGEQAVIQLGLTQGLRLLRDADDAGGADGIAHQSRAHQIAQPHRQHEAGIGQGLLKHVAHLAGEQVEAEGADGEQAQTEQQRAGHLVLAGQKHRAADADAGAAQHRIEK